MSLLSSLFGGSKKQRASISEQRLSSLSRLQHAFFRNELQPFQDKLVAEGKKDHTDVLRARANAEASAAHMLQSKAANRAAAGGGAAPSVSLASNAADVAASALKAASLAGRKLKDSATMDGLATRLGANVEAGGSLRSVAQDSFREAEQKLKFGLQRQKELFSLAGTGASIGMGNYMQKQSPEAQQQMAQTLQWASILQGV